jgi:hypothetical protein
VASDAAEGGVEVGLRQLQQRRLPGDLAVGRDLREHLATVPEQVFA